MRLVREKNCLGAWKKTSNLLLLEGKSASNLLIEIEEPGFFDEAWITDYNPKNVLLPGGKMGDDLRDVIHTIFPVKLVSKVTNRYDLYAYYLRTHLRKSRIGSKKHGGWGTYFFRLICFDTTRNVQNVIKPKGTLKEVSVQHQKHFMKNNQLERVIHALADWKSKSKAAIYCHISAPSLDAMQPIGSPCLQYIQFSQVSDGIVDMTVIYRNHDYFNKALGNFIGLGQLLKFVCKESKKKIGKLYCHSIRAYIDVSKTSMEELL